MKLIAIIGTAIAAAGVAACGSTVDPTVAPSRVPTVAPTPTAASIPPTPTGTAIAPTPTATPEPFTHAVVTAQTTCSGAWSASVRVYGFTSNVLYHVGVTDDLLGYVQPAGSGITVGPGGFYPAPADGMVVWSESSGAGFDIGDNVSVTISPDDGYTTSATIQTPEDCPPPALHVTTKCAIPGDLPDGYLAFTGGVDGMLFELYGPETDGSFPSLGPLSTDASGDGNNGSLAAGSYEYAYVMPDSGQGTIDGLFTVAACAQH